MHERVGDHRQLRPGCEFIAVHEAAHVFALPRATDQVQHQVKGTVVEHQCAQDFVDGEALPQPRGQQRQPATRQRPSREHQRQGQRRDRQKQRHAACRHRAEQQLPFSADIEKLRSERQCQPRADQQQRNHTPRHFR